MSSKTSICNMALSHLGQGLSISNFDTERSEAASVARTFYDAALDTILRKRDWSFARKAQALAYIGPDVNATWGAVFRYPTDCVVLRRCAYPSAYQGYSAGYALGADDGGALVYTSDKSAYFTYTYRNTNTETYPGDFVLAFSYLLAFMMAPRLTGGDPFKLGSSAYQAYEMMVSQAAANSFNEEGPKADDTSAFQRARNS